MTDEFENWLTEIAGKERDEYITDVLTAEKSLQEARLDSVICAERLVCDLYCIPSHNHQSFFLKLYDNLSDFIVVYVKPIIIDNSGNQIKTYRFSDCDKADRIHPGSGHTYCGIKHVPKNELLELVRIIRSLPQESEWESGGIYINGTFTVFRLLNCVNQISEFAYHDTEKIEAFNSLSNEEKEYMQNLFLTFESLIK